MSLSVLKKISDIENQFKNTPILKVEIEINGKIKRIYGKYEGVSFTGSAKDRMARYVIGESYKSGKIKKGDTIVETSSGNAGIALSALGAALGNPVTVFIPDWLSPERYKMLNSYGAKIFTVTNEEGGFSECIKRSKELSSKDGYFATNQFENELNVEGQFKTTITELFTTLERIGVQPSCFVAGYGTGGMVLAAGRMVEKLNLNCSVHPLEPSSMPLLSTNRKFKDISESHKIEGIVDDFIPKLMYGKSFDPVIVDQDDSIKIAQQINKKGFSFGISSGANLMGCIERMESMNTDIAATVFCDSANKYYSTELFDQDFGKQDGGPIFSKVKIKDIEVIRYDASI